MSIIITEKKEYTKHSPKRLVFWQFDSWSDMTSRCVFYGKLGFHDQSYDSCSKPSDNFEWHWQERGYQFL